MNLFNHRNLRPGTLSLALELRGRRMLTVALTCTTFLIGCASVGGRSSTSVFPTVPMPTVTELPNAGVSAQRNYPFLAADFNLKPFGFTETEYLIEGKANSYDVNFSWADVQAFGNTFPVTGDAKVVTKDNPYRTRMMVYKPDSTRFNGTVIVEWVNTSNTWDIPVHWFEQKNMILRDGYAYIWITNQDQAVSGANGLKAWSPTRYGNLDVSNRGKFAAEELSWDIYSQVAKAVRFDAKVLGGMAVKKVIAVGESQSAMRLTIYLNSYNGQTGNIYDGALVANSGTAQRTDLSIPIIKILTESEVTQRGPINSTMIMQADTNNYKTWQVTGATHSNLTTLLPRAAQYVRDFDGRIISDTCSIGQNSRVPTGYVYNAGVKHIENYLSNGTPIPTSPKMQVTPSATAPFVARDADGIALGGIRLPDVAVPVALNSGENAGTGSCNRNNGSHVPFSKQKLDALYPTHARYVDLVTAAAGRSVAEGFLLEADAADVIANAKASIYGRQLNCDGDATGNLCQGQFLFPQNPSVLNLRWHIYLYHLPNQQLLLAPIDQAVVQITSAYNTTDPALQKNFFSLAIASLQQYSRLVQAEATSGTLSTDASNYLTNQAATLIGELRKK